MTLRYKYLHIGKNYRGNTYKIIDEPNQSVLICNVTEEKDLGVTLDQNLNFTSHIVTKIKLENRNLGIIFRTFTWLTKSYLLVYTNAW